MHTLFSKEDITRPPAVFEIFIELHVMLPFIDKYMKLLDILFEIVVVELVVELEVELEVEMVSSGVMDIGGHSSQSVTSVPFGQ